MALGAEAQESDDGSCQAADACVDRSLCSKVSDYDSFVEEQQAIYESAAKKAGNDVRSRGAVDPLRGVPMDDETMIVHLKNMQVVTVQTCPRSLIEGPPTPPATSPRDQTGKPLKRFLQKQYAKKSNSFALLNHPTGQD